jgi:hypothetical protein
MLARGSGFEPHRFDLFAVLVLDTRMRHNSPSGTVFFCFLALVLTLAVVAGAVLVLLLTSAPARDALARLPLHRFWFSYPASSTKDSDACFWVLGAVTAVSLFSAFAVLKARAMYVRSPSPVLLYFIVYLFSVCMESLRGIAVYLYVTNTAIPFIVPISRAVYGSRFAGQLALLLMALAMLDMKYRRRLVLLGTLILIAFAISVYIPMDNTTFLSSLTYKLGDEQGAGFADLALGILTAAGMVAAGYSKNQGRFYPMAGASIFMFLGRQIVSFSVPPFLLAAGPLLMAGGSVVIMTAVGRVYGETESGDRNTS